jgi:hypothetical protein
MDSDGVLDGDDECLKDSNKSLPVRVAAEKQVDRDTDSEGVLDCDDECLKHSNKSSPVRVAAEKQVDTNTNSDGFLRSHRRMPPRPEKERARCVWVSNSRQHF